MVDVQAQQHRFLAVRIYPQQLQRETGERIHIAVFGAQQLQLQTALLRLEVAGEVGQAEDTRREAGQLVAHAEQCYTAAAGILIYIYNPGPCSSLIYGLVNVYTEPL